MENKIIETAVKALDSKKAKDIRVLKIEELTSLTSYFVICNGSWSTQVKALADECEYQMEKAGFALHHREGVAEGGWILLDYTEAVIHIYNREMRAFYDLERFWKDGTVVDISEILEEKK